jgi:hypothetical protein
MAVIPFGEWRPDLTDFQAETTRLATNAVPRADGYGPIKSYQDYTHALPDVCRGSFLAISPTDVVLYAGTATNLYRLDNTTLIWVPVSRTGAVYDPLPVEDNWTFCQYNDRVIACQQNVEPQVALLTDAHFANLAGNPPKAKYCTIVQSQLVLSGLLNFPQRIQWSAKDDITSWVLALNGADIQDFPDGGNVQGVAGGEFGVVFQTAAIRRMTFLPGSDLIFQFDRIAEGEGLKAPYSVVSAGSRIFYLGTAGFMMIASGAPPVNISKERFQRFFEFDWDPGEMRLMQGANQPNSSRVWFFYKSVQGISGLFNRAIVYDWVLDRPAYVDGIQGEFAGLMSQPGVTLDGLDLIGFTDIDAMQISLDAFQGAPGALLGLFGPTHKLGFLTGPNMLATVATPEQAFDRRYFISQVRPCTDSQDVRSRITYRSRIEDDPVTGAQSSLNRAGFCPHRIDTRMARFTTVIPAGADWSFNVGVEPLLVNTGLV